MKYNSKDNIFINLLPYLHGNGQNHEKNSFFNDWTQKMIIRIIDFCEKIR